MPILGLIVYVVMTAGPSRPTLRSSSGRSSRRCSTRSTSGTGSAPRPSSASTTTCRSSRTPGC
ncbi:hypothetical protein [Clavibacter michiganensis]